MQKNHSVIDFQFINLGWKGLLFLIFYFTLPKLYAQIPEFKALTHEVGIVSVNSHTKLYGNGASVADFDNDGDIDIYLPTDAGQNDQLYRNDGKGYFEEVAGQYGIWEMNANRAALWFDYTGDGLLDLFVVGERCINTSCEDPILFSLYEQIQDGQFIDRSETSGISFKEGFDNLIYYAVGGVAAGDLNGDEFLDLVVGIWAGGLRVFYNNADGTFNEVSESMGMKSGEVFYWQPTLIDINGNGRLDIFCNVDYHENELWINYDDHFEEMAIDYGINHASNEMGTAIGDYNNDGLLDFYVTNITRNDQGPEKRNILFEQLKVDDRVYFFEVADYLGVGESGWDWGTTFIDFNNDGFLDLATTNGWNDVFWNEERSNFWMNTLAGFVNVSEQCGFNDYWSATTLIKADFDRDGDMDLFQTLKENPDNIFPGILYRNELDRNNSKNRFIGIQPKDEGPNAFGIGCELVMKTDRRVSKQLITAGTSFYGQEAAEVYWGLKEGEEIKELQIIWPGGIVNRFFNLESGLIHKLYKKDLFIPEINVENTFEGGLKIHWNYPNENPESFVIYRSETKDFGTFTEFHVEGNKRAIIDETAIEGTLYYYRMNAYSSDVYSMDSKVVEGVYVVSGIINPSIHANIIIYPNPSDGYYTLSISNDFRGKVNIEILDAVGRNIKTFYLNKKDQDFELQLHGISEIGIYFIQIRLASSVVTRRIIIR